MLGFAKDELKRKAFHILSLIYVIAFWVLPRNIVLIGFLIAIAIVLVGEFIRAKNEKFNIFILKILGGVHRESETHKISGLPWTLLGAFLTILLFENKIFVLVSFLYLAFGDACAALFGRTYGKHKIYAGKSLEGTVACFCACLIIGLIVFLSSNQFTIENGCWLAIVGALIAAFIETIPWPLNDNFWMQIINAGILTYISRFF